MLEGNAVPNFIGLPSQISDEIFRKGNTVFISASLRLLMPLSRETTKADNTT